MDQFDSSPNCCRFTRLLSNRSLQLCGSLFVGAMVFATGLWLGKQDSGIPQSPWPPHGLNAVASATSESFSIATGNVGRFAEGFFMLDHDTGLLQCHVLYPRAGRFGAVFFANVKEVLQGGRDSGYIMVTGDADFPGGANQPGGGPGSVVYVMDTSTGAFVCYAVPFDRSAEAAQRPQSSALVIVGRGDARQVLERDSLR